MLPQFNTDSDDSEIFDHLDYSYYTDARAMYMEEFLGIGKRDKLKKAEKKQAKAEKQLEKGHIKAAERKAGKADKLFTEYKAAQDKLIQNQETKQAIGADKEVLNSLNTKQTESPTSVAGQIGDVAGSTTSQAASAPSTGGGGGGGELPYYPDASNPIPEELSGAAPGETSTPDNPTELQDVAVVGHLNKSNTIMYVLLAVGVLAFIYFMFLRKKK